MTEAEAEGKGVIDSTRSMAEEAQAVGAIGRALFNFLGPEFAVTSLALSEDQCHLLACFIIAGKNNRSLKQCDIVTVVSRLPNSGGLSESVNTLIQRGYLTPEETSEGTAIGYTNATTLLLTVVLSLSQEILNLVQEKELSDKVLKDFKPTTWN